VRAGGGRDDLKPKPRIEKSLSSVLTKPPSQRRNKQSDQRHASDVDSGTSNGHRKPTARPPPRGRDRGEWIRRKLDYTAPGSQFL